jgi:nicotinamide-nucleotide amidase
MPANNRVQALVPEGALAMENPNGTAPGLAIKLEDANGQPGVGGNTGSPPSSHRTPASAKWLIMLPGPPRELRPMFANQVVPLLRREFPQSENFVCRTLRTTGMGESVLAQRIEEPLRSLVADGLELGFCAHTGQVDVRLAARGGQAASQVTAAEAMVRERLGNVIYAEGDETIEMTIVRLLTCRRETLALAESCTGGAIANRLTNVPGSSAVFPGGFVTYSNAFKQQALGVSAESLAAQGAVSEVVAREMAEGVRRVIGADYGISVTGIAGPEGGSAAKPVGTVFLGLARAGRTTVERRFNPFDRETFKVAAGNQALEMLRQALLAG